MATQAGAEAATGPREQLYAFLASKGWEWNGHNWVKMPPVCDETDEILMMIQRGFQDE
jgi:hypothetical protein